MAGDTVTVRTAGNVESFTTGADLGDKHYTITSEGTEIPKGDLKAVQDEAAKNEVTIIEVEEEAESASG